MPVPPFPKSWEKNFFSTISPDMDSSLKTKVGSPLPLGTSASSEGVNFAVYAETRSEVFLHLHDPATLQEIESLPLKRTGLIYHLFVEGLKPGILYSYEVDGQEPLLDPYAKGIETKGHWNDQEGQFRPLGVVMSNAPYDWEGDRPPSIQKEHMVIYEMHVRGFTQDPSSGVRHPGTYQGVLEKIGHFKEMGVNALELLPIFEFNEAEYKKINPVTKLPLCNFWGYTTANFFCPMNRYASVPETETAQKEFKDLVKGLHKNGIEIILDVVYNHTGEGNINGPTFSFKGLANSTYYLLDEQGQYLNFSGCGNTLNCNDPIVREFILSSLRYWVTEFHIDGFRFDLASILARGMDGFPLAHPPLVEAIARDPVLAGTKLIAEAWDAAGLYQVGHFYFQGNRWSEWNGVYRDVVRRFVKGTHGVKGEFATRLCGSKDLYYRQKPSASINFVTCHDGFSLADLVSYNHKHNLENGENNQDGTGWNDSWNCGVEGPTDDPTILALRERQMRNFHVALMVSQGVPMLHMGDEYAHTKHGNNNTWCQDNRLSWFLWDKLEDNKDFYRFYKFLISFRNSHPHFHHGNFVTDEEIEWHGTQPYKPRWEEQNSLIAFTLLGESSHLFIAFNSSDQEAPFELPPPKAGSSWRLVVNTGNPSPADISEENEPVLTPSITLLSYSSLILESGNA